MTHKELALLIQTENYENNPKNHEYSYWVKDKKFLMTQPKLAKHFKVSINKINRAIDLLKDQSIVRCNKKAGCEIKTYDKPFVYIEDQVISNLVKSSEYLNFEFNESDAKYFFKGQEITDPMQLKNPNSIDIYTYDELYEKYDKEFHSESPEIQDFSSQIEDCIKDNFQKITMWACGEAIDRYVSIKDYKKWWGIDD